MFSRKELRALLIPLVIEQVLTGIMGVADTFMVSNVGEAAVSAVSLVDSVNMLVTYFLSALAAGGTIVCAQYIGREDPENANKAGRQVMLASLFISLILCVLLVLLRRPLLHLIFGKVEQDVMDGAVTYLFVTALSYPFLAMYTSSAALHRAIGDSRRPMYVAAGADILNIAGNAVLIFVFHLGVFGAALATLFSRICSAVIMLYFQHRPGQVITLDRYATIRPDRAMIRRILRIGIPTAVENGMFQLGKLIVQSTVSILGTTALAAEAIVTSLEAFTSQPAMAIGTGLLTVAGQCIGRGRMDEARRYIRRLTRISTVVVLVMGILLSAAMPLVVRVTALSEEGAVLTCQLIWFISIMKVFFWPTAFTLPNGLRAAGDVSFTMIVSIVSMWVLRDALSWILCRYTSLGLWGVWIGWSADWVARCILYKVRFCRNEWERHDVLG